MSLDSATELVTGGDLTAYVKYEDTTESQAFFLGSKPSIEVGIDPSRRAESGYLKGMVNQAYFMALQETMMNPGRMRTSITESKSLLDSATGLSDDQRSTYLDFLNSLDTFMATVQADTVPAGTAGTEAENYSPFSEPDIEFVSITRQRIAPKTSWEFTFPQALQWALIGVCASFAISIVVERTRGTFLRLRLAPITRAHILGGKGLACFLACVLDCAALIAFGVLVFDVRVASFAHLLLALGAAGICFVGLMMLISVLGKTEQAVGGAGWAILLVIAMTGGGMVPLFVMPGWLRTVSDFSPVKWSVLAFEGAVWRGFTLTDMLEPVAVLVGIGVVCFTAGVTILHRTDR
ncbi:ABC transporter permease subunit [candidate division GN15 bacterium]|nr:ABC transporter permease subunit [candidate division GN15 bacterium]